MKLKKPMPKSEPTIALYPKIGLRALVAITSELMPNAGNKYDVHFRVTQEPKQVLVQDRESLP